MTALVLAAALQPVPLPACAWVRAEGETAGAGFVVDSQKRWLVTARHVVADHTAVDVFFPWVENGTLVTDRAAYLRARGRLRERGLLVTGTVVRTHDAADLALVELPSFPAGTPAVTLAAARVGEPLRVVGHRLDLDTLWNRTSGPARQVGVLAAGYTWRGRTLAAGAGVVLGQLPIEEGDSGGPAFDSRGNCVGMAAALRRQAPDAAVVISADEIRRFLSAAADAPPAERSNAAESLQRAAVWVRPTATERFAGGVLIDRDRGLVLSSAKGLAVGDRVGLAFALPRGAGVVGERAPYRDPVGLQLKGAWRAAAVLARDTDRDLALLRVDSVPASAQGVNLAANPPAAGDAVHAVSHPGGVEFAFVYAAGVVRQRGRVALGDGEKAPRVGALVLQLPTQAGSPGGPVANARGELVGVLAARDGAQSVGYAADPAEVGAFLDANDVTRLPRTLPGLAARLNAVPGRVAAQVAVALARHGKLTDALAFDPACPEAHLAQATQLFERGFAPREARDFLDPALSGGRFHAPALRLRADLSVRATDWRAARGDLERLLDADPADTASRRKLVRVLLELGKDADAASAVGDAVRADAGSLTNLVTDLNEQADALEKKFPGAPGVPAGWLERGLTAARDALPAGPGREGLTAALRRAAGATDAERLRLLRGAGR
ncbi:S1 family peptidase [Urbifossiella limnaea]|uniref:Trypsin n=1 Tax=Urbifossiella limnaea TaxID=2528023 RepID=A0A517XMV7_9BACT|nr:serine protease [Urbifossiella limnaea]QDU18845.1 Trypsin [Urbifossiella limnaea]